jgi:hypothetical protein
LPGNEQVDFTAVVFIIGEAFVNLSSGQLRETVCPHRVDCLAIPQQADNVVNGNPGILHNGIPTPHAG